MVHDIWDQLAVADQHSHEPNSQHEQLSHIRGACSFEQRDDLCVQIVGRSEVALAMSTCNLESQFEQSHPAPWAALKVTQTEPTSSQNVQQWKIDWTKKQVTKCGLAACTMCCMYTVLLCVRWSICCIAA